MNETLSIKVSPGEKAKLRQLAESRGLKLSTLLREGLLKVTAGAVDKSGPTCYQCFAKYLEEPGNLGASGLGDLSVNKRRMRNFGKGKAS